MAAPVQRNNGGRRMAAPAFQLRAGNGFNNGRGPAQRRQGQRGPVQMLGRAPRPRSQEAGTCGLYSLINAIGHLYQINNDNDMDTVRDTMLQAAGNAGGQVTGQGEVTSFQIANQIVTEYNRLTNNFNIQIAQQTITNQTNDENSWRTALGIDQEDDQAEHSATMAVDSSLYSAFVNALRGRNRGTVSDNTTTATRNGNLITISGLNPQRQSTNGEDAHWVTVTNITAAHVEVMDPNYPRYRLQFPVGEAQLLSTTLLAPTRGNYLDTVYGGAGGERGFIQGQGGGTNPDYQTIAGNQNVQQVEDEMTQRLTNTNRAAQVALSGLALNVTRA